MLYLRRVRRLTMLSMLVALLLCIVAPAAALAQESGEGVVRVGWFDSQFCYLDKFGRRRGIDYEYRHRISAYTGWTYEYVEDSWPNLLQLLMDGEIDLLCDVSYKPERAEHILYADIPMGTESYYIYVDAHNADITAEDFHTLDGKRIGVNKGSVQEGFLRDWAEKNDVTIEVIPMVEDEDESMEMVTQGHLDGYASIYSFAPEQEVIPVCRVGSSDYFYAVSRDRPDLLAELNVAMAGIQEEDPYFNQWLSEERYHVTSTDALLTPAQEAWLAEHGTIRIGYCDDCLPFCDADEGTGELTGALKDYLAHAESSLGGADVRFEATAWPSTAAALEALESGDVDCVFPVYASSFDADQMGIRLTSPAMFTEMNAIVRATDGQRPALDGDVAVADGNTNVEAHIMDRYPAAERKSLTDDAACLEAVASGEADCVLLSNYRIPIDSDTLRERGLASIPTGESMSLSFAVDGHNRDLYFIMNKTVAMSTDEEMDAALASYLLQVNSVSFAQVLKDNWLIVTGVLALLFSLIIFLLYQKLRAERTASEQRSLLQEAAKVAELQQTITSLLDNMPSMSYTKDATTGAYLACNQAFAAYAGKKSPEEVVGLTDAELFDAQTVRRLAADDRMALSMDEPYIFFEEVVSASGERRHIKTTKQKYTDAQGRLCVLGVSLDVTSDTVHIRRGSVDSREDYEKARATGIIYAHIAQALARGYTNLYYVDLNTEEFIEYVTDADDGSLIEARRGWHFFELCLDEADQVVYPDDRDLVKRSLDRRTLVAALDRERTFMLTYRLLLEQGPSYVTMRVTRMQDDDRFIIMGVTDVEEQVRQRQYAARMEEEQIAYARLSALAGDYLCVYIVDPATGRYRELSATSGFENVARSHEGLDFFDDTRTHAPASVVPEDLNRFMALVTRDNVLAEVERRGSFTLSYRLALEGAPRYVQLKAVMTLEQEGPRLIVGISDIDAQVRQEETYVKHLARAQKDALVDPLTGVKSRHAFREAEERLDAQLARDGAAAFAISVLDVNDLKRVNDTEGHKAGDAFLRQACSIVCHTFKHSPVFRVGGDEFAVISQGHDLDHIDELVAQMAAHNEEALESGGIVIACGMARCEGDSSTNQVFERADQRMYENKSGLKSRKRDLPRP